MTREEAIIEMVAGGRITFNGDSDSGYRHYRDGMFYYVHLGDGAEVVDTLGSMSPVLEYKHFQGKKKLWLWAYPSSVGHKQTLGFYASASEVRVACSLDSARRITRLEWSMIEVDY